MKKYVFMMVLGLGVLNAKSQKLEKPFVDKISGEVSIAAKAEVLSNKLALVRYYLAGYVVKGRDYWLLDFNLKDNIGQYYYISKGDHAIIKFSDGKLSEISALADVQSSTAVNEYGSSSESDISYFLTADDVAALKNGKISVIRIMTSVGAFDYDISGKKSEIIKKQLELLDGKQ